MDITPIILNYESKKTESHVGQIVLRTLGEMVHALGDNPQELEAVRAELLLAAQVVQHKIFKLRYPDLAAKKGNDHIETLVPKRQDKCGCTSNASCNKCMNDYNVDLQRRLNNRNT